ncbi:hypothetical protein BDN70DRAFT_531175 [Pholiota conissans]|uniref:Uncharacterized protein n=1 Tax=Pholiota conissans TaxID=109636 RepID=A0A9P5YNE1_9AGAR|nr:hypothetical protein BDN70DRAFT_531175 [Pholiota conissans]
MRNRDSHRVCFPLSRPFSFLLRLTTSNLRLESYTIHMNVSSSTVQTTVSKPEPPRIHPSIDWSVCLSVCLSVRPSVCPSVRTMIVPHSTPRLNPNRQEHIHLSVRPSVRAYLAHRRSHRNRYCPPSNPLARQYDGGGYVMMQSGWRS